MRNHSLAGWVLRRFVSSERAETLLGDLLEVSGGNSATYYKLLLMTVGSLVWRPAAAFAATCVIGGGALCVLQTLFFGSAHVAAADAAAHAWGSTLALAVGFVWIVAVFSLARYGRRDSLARIAVGLGSLGSVGIAFWWIPMVTYACVVIACVVAVVGISMAKSRGAFMALIMLTVLQFGIWFGGLTAMLTPFAVVLKHGNVTMGVVATLLYVWLAVTYVVLMGVVCFACTRARRWVAV